jgi:Fe-S-cluster containining protein
MTSSSHIETCADQAAEILAEIEAATTAFAARTGLACRARCGQCCLKPGIEAQVVELLPLARELLTKGEAEEVYDRAAADPEGPCIFYRGEAHDQTLGRCSRYSLRPSLCRLFGFAAVSGKDNRPPELAACHWHKRLIPDVVAAAQASIDAGESVPRFSEYSLRLAMLAPDSALSQRLPINRALALAIEKLSLVGIGPADPAGAGEPRLNPAPAYGEPPPAAPSASASPSVPSVE